MNVCRFFLVLTLSITAPLALAWSQTSCVGQPKTQTQLLTEWQTCAAQGLQPGCLTPARIQDIICAAPSLIPLFGGDTGTGGTVGIVPAPPPGSFAAGKFLSAGGNFLVPFDNGHNGHLIPGKTFFGNSLSNQFGTSTTCSSGDWASQLIPNATCVGVTATLTSPGIPYGSIVGARLSESGAGATCCYSFASVSIGINDSPTDLFAMETDYNETRAYYGAAPTLAQESDVINSGVPDTVLAQITPYNFLPSSKTTIANKWLSNGRPDLLYLDIAQGTITAGDIFTATFTGGYTGSPQTVSTTAIGGDTVFSIIGRLVTNFNANSTLIAAGMYAGQVPQSSAVAATVPNGAGLFLSISGAPLPSAMTTTFTTTGSETVNVSYGGNASVMVAGLNNSTQHTSGTSNGTGQYLTGFVIRCDTLAGGTCTDSGGFGEFAALGRKQAIDFYSAHTPGSPVSRIFSSQVSTTTAGLSLNFKDGEIASVEDGSGVAAATVSPTIFYREGVESVGATVGSVSPGSGSTVVMADTTEIEIIQPSGTLASLTVQLPDCNTSYPNRRAQFTTTQIISSLTVTATSGSVNSSPSSLTAGSGASYICAGGGSNVWFRLN